MIRLQHLAIQKVLFISIAYMAGCNSKDACLPTSSQSEKRDDLECRFTLGRTAYGRKDYKQAAEHWGSVVRANPNSERDKTIIAIAHGTLGYLFYYGKGVKEDRKRAVELYKTAVRLGDLESRQHLGFAFSDQTNDFYDPVTAYAWYRSVEHHYKIILEEETDKRVLQTAKDVMARLKPQLSDGDLKIAEEKSSLIE